MNAMINEVFFISTSFIEFQRPAGTLFVLPVKLSFYCFLDKKIYLKKDGLAAPIAYVLNHPNWLIQFLLRWTREV